MGSEMKETSQEVVRKAFEGSYNILIERIDNPEQQESITEPAQA